MHLLLSTILLSGKINIDKHTYRSFVIDRAFPCLYFRFWKQSISMRETFQNLQTTPNRICARVKDGWGHMLWGENIYRRTGFLKKLFTFSGIYIRVCFRRIGSAFVHMHFQLSKFLRQSIIPRALEFQTISSIFWGPIPTYYKTVKFV